jgi:hypothetical protein
MLKSSLSTVYAFIHKNWCRKQFPFFISDYYPQRLCQFVYAVQSLIVAWRWWAFKAQMFSFAPKFNKSQSSNLAVQPHYCQTDVGGSLFFSLSVLLVSLNNFLVKSKSFELSLLIVTKYFVCQL